jgi:hypothetical protein
MLLWNLLCIDTVNGKEARILMEGRDTTLKAGRYELLFELIPVAETIPSFP